MTTPIADAAATTAGIAEDLQLQARAVANLIEDPQYAELLIAAQMQGQATGAAAHLYAAAIMLSSVAAAIAPTATPAAPPAAEPAA